MKTKSIITAAIIAATLAGGAAHADTINGEEVVFNDGHRAVTAHDVAYNKDGDKWYNEITGEEAAYTLTPPTTESTKESATDNTGSTTTPPTTESTSTNAGTTTTESTTKTPPVNTEITTTESTKKTESTNAGNTGTKGTTTKSGTIQSSNHQSSVTLAATQTPTPTAQSTAQSAHVGNSSSPRRDVVRPANISKQSDEVMPASAWTPSKGDEISARAEDFGGKTLPVTGSDDTIGEEMTMLGAIFAAIAVWAALHIIWKVTSPRRRRDK